MKAPVWSPAEDRILELNQHMPPRELVALLPSRTLWGIAQRRYALGLRFDNPRHKAQAEGATKYLGAPCKHGHIGLRYARGGHCVECEAIRKEQAA